MRHQQIRRGQRQQKTGSANANNTTEQQTTQQHTRTHTHNHTAQDGAEKTPHAAQNSPHNKMRGTALHQEQPPGGGWVGLGLVKASPGRLPTVRAAFPAGPDWAAVPGCPVTRPTGLLTAPRPRGGARGREMPPCLCVCALVCLRGGGGRAVAHLLAPLLFGVGAGKCVPGAPGPGREAGEPDAEPAGGDVGLGSQPPRHKDMLPNHSTTAYWRGKAVVRGTTGVRPALLDCLRHRWCCLAGWVRLPRPRAYPGQMEGHQGTECASLPWVPPVLAALAAALQPA